jgi:hypothetical protein
MPSLSKENRKLLENTVAAARVIAVKGATTVLRDQYAVGESAPWPHMSDLENKLRVKLRAHGRQLGDLRGPRDTQELDRLAQACAYEHWHRMLFARFLAENDLLLDPDHGVAMTLEEIRELAQEQHRDWQELAAELAQRMLLAVFRPEDPVLSITLPPETRLQLEEKLALLPAEAFLADDSLGWVYQFWQRDEKERVNKSEVKIGADELPAVTQLFTEDYMVLFLLENTLGAWWTAKRRDERKDPALPGYIFTYLRLNEDGSPAADGFDGWPRMASELRVLDPCMGSGHFLVFALPILARMRMEEEDLGITDALAAVLKDNLFGLEIDERCAQIAAFNLALAAWRMAGEHFPLPEFNLACCGIGPNATKEQWIRLGEEIAARGGMPANANLFGTEDSLLSEPVKRTMESLHELFSQAPVLGSLIDPSKLRVDLFQTDYKTVAPLFTAVLKAEHETEETREQVIAAAGMVKAAALLAGKYTLVATNVPYLGREGHCDALAGFATSYAADASGDLATLMLHRCVNFLRAGGRFALVVPQNWWIGRDYIHFRKRFLRDVTFRLAVVLGEEAWWTFGNRGPNTVLLIAELEPVASTSVFLGLDVSTKPGSKVIGLESKAAILRGEPVSGLSGTPELVHLNQSLLAESKTSRITIAKRQEGTSLSNYVESGEGCSTGDADRFLRCFWEVDSTEDWLSYCGPGYANWHHCDSSSVVYWQKGAGELSRSDQARMQNIHMWSMRGVLVGRVRGITATVFNGGCFSKGAVLVCPKDEFDLPGIYAFLNSPEYEQHIRTIDPRVSAATSVITDVPFDALEWRAAAAKSFPEGLPAAPTFDPTQIMCNGDVARSLQPLQVAVAKLVGYKWPRQTGLLASDDLNVFASGDGIVPLSSLAGDASAAERLRALLAAAYGEEWSASKLAELLGSNESLEIWLRDSFFDEHCNLFKGDEARPFVWHVWDGRKDGFNALVNYHKLAAPNGEGRKTLEKLIYTTLGDWITRQRADVTAGVDGADGRLAAAEHLRAQLEKILQGEKPYDIFVRWKPLDQQPIGWEPDINDGVRLNIRPWLAATLSPGTKPKKDACILRVTPKIKYGKDRGKELQRETEDFPWFWTWDEKTDDFAGGAEFDGARWNDPHYSLSTKQKARDRKKQREGA